MSEVRKGFMAGAVGLLAMLGVTFLIRRFVEGNTPNPKMHYEAVVEKGYQVVAGEKAELDEDIRIRLGETAHLLFGAFWGIVFALLLRNREIRPIRQGATLGTTLWFGAFAGYLPALKIAKPLWQMGLYRAARTLVTHITFSVTTLLVLRSLRHS